MNRKQLLGALAFFGAASSVRADHQDNVTNKTRFVVERHYTSCSPEHLTGWRHAYKNHRMMAREDGIWGSFMVVGFGGKTRENDKAGEWGEYFGICGKGSCCRPLIVSESGACDTLIGGTAMLPAPSPITGGGAAWLANTHDILSQNLGIRTTSGTFQSEISFAPKQSYGGAAFTYRQALSSNEDKGWWIEAIVPVLHVKTKLCFNEKVITTGGAAQTGYAANARTFFKGGVTNHDLKFCKITDDCCDKDCCECDTSCCKATTRGNDCNDCCDKSCECCDDECGCDETRVANLEINIGYDWVRNECCRYGSHFGVVFPTGNEGSARRFMPVVSGHDHWGIQWGNSMGFKLWEGDDAAFGIAFDHRSVYLFENDVCVCFDLCCNPWSRFMPFSANAQATTTAPGANSLTRRVDVTPRTVHEANSALMLDYNDWFNFEIGYHLTCRQSEKLELCNTASVGGIAGSSAGLTQNNATIRTRSLEDLTNMGICQQILDDKDHSTLCNRNNDGNICIGTVDTNNDAFSPNATDRHIPITPTAADLQTAAHPTTISHKVYGAFNFAYDENEYPFWGGIGGAYTFSADNTSNTRWSVWGKLGISL